MRKTKVIFIIVLALAGAALAVLLFARNSGPPVVVHGNFSAKDVAQIQNTVRRQLWLDTLPNFSVQTIKAFPRMVKRALKTRVAEIENPDGHPVRGKSMAYAWFSTNLQCSGYFLTGNASGWSVSGDSSRSSSISH